MNWQIMLQLISAGINLMVGSYLAYFSYFWDMNQPESDVFIIDALNTFANLLISLTGPTPAAAIFAILTIFSCRSAYIKISDRKSNKKS